MTIPELVETIPALRQENARLSANLKWTALELDRCRAAGQELQARLAKAAVECSYCHRVFAADDSAQTDHWRECERHPARAEIERLNQLNRLYHNQIVLMQQAEAEAV